MKTFFHWSTNYRDEKDERRFCYYCEDPVDSYWISEPYRGVQHLYGICRNCCHPRDDMYHGMTHAEVEVLLVMSE
jgi:hypothetical protein